MKPLFKLCSDALCNIRKLIHSITHYPTYKIIALEQNEFGEYTATVQITGKDLIFKAKPEEILAEDTMTDKFSPRDVRALTYLGYLGINSPKYRILAKRLAENEKLLFAVHQKGTDQVEMKTAAEITKDEAMLRNFDQKDAHIIGYTVATEEILNEKKQMELAKKQLKHQKNNE